MEFASHMRFELPSTLDGLLSYLPNFFAIIGDKRWWTRADQLYNHGLRSPFQQIIVERNHWLEMEVSAQMCSMNENQTCTETVYPQTWAALRFVGMVVEVHSRLSLTGRTQLFGRLRDCIKSGFAGLYLELEMARLFLDEGYDIALPDLEHCASYDLHFWKGSIQGELECKSISADAGRKIHQRDFYRLIESLEKVIQERMQHAARDILLVTLDDRLPPDVESQQLLGSFIGKAIADQKIDVLDGPFFRIERQEYEQLFTVNKSFNSTEFHSVCQKKFGQNCHASGAVSEVGCCVIVMRSNREDDHSAPEVDALKKAASQLSGTLPSFIAVQYEDVEPAHLTSPQLRSRRGILDNAIFHFDNTQHVIGIYHCAYPSIHLTEDGVATPALFFENPNAKYALNDMPFQLGLSNSEFAKRLNVDPAKTDPDGYHYGIGT